MYELPIPLAGHCVVIISNRHVVFLGGGTYSYFHVLVILFFRFERNDKVQG